MHVMPMAGDKLHQHKTIAFFEDGTIQYPLNHGLRLFMSMGAAAVAKGSAAG